MLSLGLREQGTRERLESRVGDQPHSVGNTLGLTVLIHRGYGEARVRPYLDLYPRPRLAQPAYDAPQHRHCPSTRVAVSWAQYGRYKMAGVAVEDK